MASQNLFHVTSIEGPLLPLHFKGIEHLYLALWGNFILVIYQKEQAIISSGEIQTATFHVRLPKESLMFYGYKTSATLWKDWRNADLDIKNASNVPPRYYHGLVSSGNKRFNARWPQTKKLQQPELYFKE
ncbi:hypothetical protein CDAR_210091 [Caerostris darwini]|uniref:Uncharacterized protein n=1 Tax=Caerostris darwini TaxID=1538125 RepID=A0AAV4SBX8_9ARAC|nr:hypothetical protein CDAR_210091 [Caerostris darwini]